MAILSLFVGRIIVRLSQQRSLYPFKEDMQYIHLVPPVVWELNVILFFLAFLDLSCHTSTLLGLLGSPSFRKTDLSVRATSTAVFEIIVLLFFFFFTSLLSCFPYFYFIFFDVVGFKLLIDKVIYFVLFIPFFSLYSFFFTFQTGL